MAGTTAMSIFSYLWSGLSKKQFREPALLSLLLKGKRNKRDETGAGASLAGWLLHYMTGALFSLGYTNKLLKGRKSLSIKKGTLMGGIDGIFGIGIWKTVLKLHPRPPKINRGRYFLHLFLAHLVFSFFTSRTLLSLQKKETKGREEGISRVIN